MAELVKHIDTHIEMDFMMVSSYHGGTASSGVINIKQDVTQDIKGRHVLFVEDIIDTGQTLKSLRDMFIAREAASVKIATLLDKPEGRVVEIEADYTCFTIPNEFVVGYGLVWTIKKIIVTFLMSEFERRSLFKLERSIFNEKTK
ncbi:phosphoribosyl transferase domain protein (plasmid) [Streptococcus oralis]|nr:phosphoribosyl transferase domain protein [Streptococcus oralis]